MATINQRFMQRVKYGMVNLGLIVLVITLACASTWAIAAAALWQSIIVSALAYVWYQKLQLPVNNELVYYLTLLTIAIISFTLPTLYTPNFFFILLSILSIFNILFDDFILLTPLKPYFMSSNLASIRVPIGLQHFHDMDPRHFDNIIDRLRQNAGETYHNDTEQTSKYVLSEPRDATKDPITCEVDGNQCPWCLEKPKNNEMLMFAKPKKKNPMGVNSTKLSSFYHSQCLDVYRKHEQDTGTKEKAVNTMPNGNESGTVDSWYLGEYKKEADQVEIITCFPVIKSTSK